MRLLFGLTFVLAPAFSFAEGCGGSVLERGATCTSVCAHLVPCQAETSLATCVEGCQVQEDSCASTEGAAAFQSLLDCLEGLSCNQGPNASPCQSQIDQVGSECSGDIAGLPPAGEGGSSYYLPDAGVVLPEIDADDFDVQMDSLADVTTSDEGSGDAGFEAGSEGDAAAPDASDASPD
jgi:hypothetical protein